VKNVKFKVRVS